MSQRAVAPVLEAGLGASNHPFHHRCENDLADDTRDASWTQCDSSAQGGESSWVRSDEGA